MSNPWFRMYSEAIDDEKLRLLAFEDRWHFIALLCCKNMELQDDMSVITRRKIAVKMGLDLRELGEVARRLSEVGLIDQDTLQPKKWDERQFKSDSSIARVRRYRDKLKVVDNTNDLDMKRPCNVTVTPQDTDTDTEADIKQKGIAVSKKPTLIIPDWLPEDVLQNFKEHRAKMKKPMTDEAVRLFITKLSSFKEAGHDPVECINRSILNGWAGVFEPKDQGNNVVKQTEWKTY